MTCELYLAGFACGEVFLGVYIFLYMHRNLKDQEETWFGLVLAAK